MKPARTDKQVEAQAGPVGETLQPSVHRIVGNGPGDEVRRQDPQRKPLGKQGHDSPYRGAEDFADTDFFGPLFSAVCREPQDAQTGNEDG